MDLLITILTCSLYAQDDALVRAIAESTPQGNPYAIIDLTIDATQMDAPGVPKTAADASARASDILAHGGRPLLGLLQIPPAWMTAHGRTVADAFDPCTNIAVGTEMLSAFDAQCAKALGGKASISRRHHLAPSAARRRCVLDQYAEAIGAAEFALVTSLELRHQRPVAASIAEAPIFAPVAAPHFGPDQVFVPVLALQAVVPRSPSTANTP